VITGYEYGVHPYALETCGNWALINMNEHKIK
jgi:hypothetical protein